MPNKPQHLAFTVAYNGIVNQPMTDVAILDDEGKLMHSAKALWDTGAQVSCVSEKFAQESGFKPIGKSCISGVGWSVDCNVYIINLWLPNQVRIDCKLMSLPHDISCDILIWMDIIAQGDFAISQDTSKTVLSFRLPSHSRVDFVRGSVGTQNGWRNQPCKCWSGKKAKRCCWA